jgi:hypothetical protein
MEYNELKESLKSSKALEALDRVNEAIEFFTKEKVIFNVASIGRYCEDKWEGPKTQSIRNNTLLSSFIKEKSKNVKKSISIVSKKNKNIDNFILNKVEDEEVKEYIKIQQEKYKLLEEQYNNLKKITNQLKPINIDKMIEENLNMFDIQDLQEIKQIEVNHSNKDFNIIDFIEILNNKFLSKLDIKLKVIFNNEKTLIINENTNSIIYEN